MNQKETNSVVDSDVELAQLYKRQQALLEETRDPDFNKDARENSVRDDVLRELRSVNDMIIEKERAKLLHTSEVFIGTITYNRNYNFRYLKIMSRGKDIDTNSVLPFVGYLTSDTVVNQGSLYEQSAIPRPISDKSAIGKAIQNKLPGIFKIKTANGLLEIEVSKL